MNERTNCSEIPLCSLYFVCVGGSSYSGSDEATWPAPSESVLSSGTGTSFMSSNQSRSMPAYDQQLLAGAVCGPTEARYIRSNQLARGYAIDTAQADVGYGSVEMPSTFVASAGSQRLDAARSMDRSLDAVSLRSPPAAHSRPRQDYIGNYSPVSASTPAAVVASSVHGVSQLPAHEWDSASLFGSHNLLSDSWQNMHQQRDGVYYMAAPQTTSFSPSQTSMQYSTLTSVGSPNAGSTSDVLSPMSSPYSPSLGKTYSEAAGSEAFQLPLHMQSHYFENLLQLHYLLLASNKLLAPRYPPSRYPPSVGAPRFDTYIPGTASSAVRPTMFDINRLSSSPSSFQHGFAAARFPKLGLNWSSRIILLVALVISLLLPVTIRMFLIAVLFRINHL